MPEISAQVSSATRGLTREFDLIAHNLANVSTPGFKRRFNNFSEMLAQQTNLQAAGAENRPPSVIDFSQGTLVETGRTLDMALCGNGFFVIETPQGPLYARNGMFRLDENNHIVDLTGNIVAGQSGPITVPPTVGPSQLFVATDGTLSANGISIGKFKLADFGGDQGKLVPAGLNSYRAPKNLEPAEAENLIVKQGYQEGSNVQMTEELVNMIMISRLYEANMKMVSESGQTARNLIDVAMS